MKGKIKKRDSGHRLVSNRAKNSLEFTFEIFTMQVRSLCYFL